jgi:hypothetical protein
MKRLAFSLLVFFLIGTLAGLTHAQNPDFTGVWAMDMEKSDDLAQRVREAAGSTRGITRSRTKQIVERMQHLARGAEEIEITQTAADFKVFDLEGNLHIYYLDGEKRVRETPWGEKLQVLALWNENNLIVETEGKDLGKVREVYTFDGEQLVYVLQLEFKDFKNTVISRKVYNRKPE